MKKLLLFTSMFAFTGYMHAKMFEFKLLNRTNEPLHFVILQEQELPIMDMQERTVDAQALDALDWTKLNKGEEKGMMKEDIRYLIIQNKNNPRNNILMVHQFMSPEQYTKILLRKAKAKIEPQTHFGRNIEGNIESKNIRHSPFRLGNIEEEEEEIITYQ